MPVAERGVLADACPLCGSNHGRVDHKRVQQRPYLMLSKPAAVIYRMDGADKEMMAVLAVVSAPVVRSDMSVSDDRMAVAIRTFLLIGI